MASCLLAGGRYVYNHASSSASHLANLSCCSASYYQSIAVCRHTISTYRSIQQHIARTTYCKYKHTASTTYWNCNILQHTTSTLFLKPIRTPNHLPKRKHCKEPWPQLQSSQTISAQLPTAVIQLLSREAAPTPATLTEVIHIWSRTGGSHLEP